MSGFTLGEANVPARANNDNYPPALCIEVFTPNVGWTIHVQQGSSVHRVSLAEFIGWIYIIENGRRNKVYLDNAKDMRVCLDRIKSYGVLS